MMMKDAGEVRLDKWLWAARFFKTRSLASKAVGGGHVHVNGQRVKPSRTIHVGDRLLITRGHEEFSVTVLGLSDRRGPAAVARTLYEESEDSLHRRLQRREERRLFMAATAGPERRPDKRDRRKIRQFKRKD
ncbi:MAG: RNA-binding protein [Desulfobulbus propionicus]|nr:MAG: RNA-binding protein [Desulfobulbus propionicus]